MRKVKVVWEDIYSTGGGWSTSLDLDDHRPIVAEQLGYLYKETDHYIVIVDSFLTDGETFGTATAIPRGCIKEIVYLDESDSGSSRRLYTGPTPL